MPRRQSLEEGKCKIRKRGNSSSSSSSIVRNYRLKRPILVGKRAGSSTPVPTWKMTGGDGGNSSAGGSLGKEKVPVKYCHRRQVSESFMSARKLAATLWEMNEVPSSLQKQGLELELEEEEIIKMNVERTSTLVPCVPKRRNRRHVSASSSSQLLLPDNNDLGRRSESTPDACRFIEVGYRPGERTITKVHKLGAGNRLNDVSDSLATSKELLKVLNHVWGLESKHPAGISVLSALKLELHRARAQVRKLIQEERETDNLLRQFADERRAWKMKEQDRISRANASNGEELEKERKLRRQTERLNKKLGKELGNTKASLSKAVKEVESEKRAREILEQVCDELARGIGDDRAEFEELKKESEKVREEVEKEREMLQLADVLREERVQMKLSEAKYEYEEKNAAVDKLKSELEEYLGARKGDISSNDDKIKELEEYLKKTLVGSYHQNREKVLNGEEDSGDSDLRSIELNMDNHRKSFEWGYAYAIATQNDVGKSILEQGNNQKHVFLERNTSDCIEWDLSNISHGFSQKKEYDEDEIKRYEMIKDLRDHIVSGSSGLSSYQGLGVLQEAV